MSVERQLRELPTLASRTLSVFAVEYEDNSTTATEAPARFVHPLPGPRLPPGLDMGTIDRDLNKQGSPDQLVKLEQCTRTVVQECDPATYATFPDLDDRATWRTEVAWLLTTVRWWSTDQWCNEWITTEVAAIRDTLIGRIERRNGWTRCALCGGTIATHSTETLDIAECQGCERVVSMRERESLTTSQAATMLGITEAAVRKQVERGQLRKVGRRGKENLLAPGDGLDWARRKLGLLA